MGFDPEEINLDELLPEWNNRDTVPRLINVILAYEKILERKNAKK